MKKLLSLTIGFSCFTVFVFAQQNPPIYESGGNIGIATNTPGYRLDVNGPIMSRGDLLSAISGEIGGRLYLRNPGKTANGTARDWAIFNMSGGYGNSLQFWAYDQLSCGGGGMCVSRFTITDNGNVGIGTQTPSAKLAVVGGISAQRIKVSAVNAWPDYVFETSYALPSLREVEQHIMRYKHLPDVPSAKEVEDNGLDLGDNQAVLLKKIEELTLYMIAQDKKMDEQEKKMKAMEDEIKKLKSVM